MAFSLMRSTHFTTVGCNIRRNFSNPSRLGMNIFQINSRPRIPNLIVQQRSLYRWSNIFGKRSEIYLKNKDNVPNEFVLIYRQDTLDQYFKWIYVPLLVMAGTLIALVVFKLDRESLESRMNQEFKGVRNDYLIFLFSFCLCFTIFYGCMKRIPVRIYKIPSKTKYLFICNSGIPFTTRKITCQRGECVKEDPTKYPSFIPADMIYKLGNMGNIFLFEDRFRTPADLHVLLGQQEDYDDE